MRLSSTMSRRWIVLLIVALAGAAPSRAQGPVKVVVQQGDGGYQLLRDGKPYFVQGANYWTDPHNMAYPLAGVAQRGGNSVRAGGDKIPRILDAAGPLGLSVMVNLPLASSLSGFDYTDEAQVRGQFETMKTMVLRHKDHPALLVWGVGNEIGREKHKSQATPRVWDAVNELVKMIHAVDPHHPAMTVIGMGSVKAGDVKEIVARCPDLDLLGINAYKDIAEVPRLLREGGWTKPYLITEWGHDGNWHAQKTKWGAASSTPAPRTPSSSPSATTIPSSRSAAAAWGRTSSTGRRRTGSRPRGTAFF